MEGIPSITILQKTRNASSRFDVEISYLREVSEKLSNFNSADDSSCSAQLSIILFKHLRYQQQITGHQLLTNTLTSIRIEIIL